VSVFEDEDDPRSMPAPFRRREQANPINTWGSRQTLLAGAAQTNEARLVDARVPVPQSIAVCCLPDPGGAVLLYRISYGTAGGRRVSALVPAGTYIAGGEIVTVDMVLQNSAVPATGEAFAWICYTAPTVP